MSNKKGVREDGAQDQEKSERPRLKRGIRIGRGSGDEGCEGRASLASHARVASGDCWLHDVRADGEHVFWGGG